MPYTKLNNPISTRCFAIVDLENLCGGADQVGQMQSQIRTIFEQHQHATQMTVVGCGRLALHSNPDFLWTWSDARLVSLAGIDGADKALCEVLDDEPAAERSWVLQIWSGDHLFAPLAKKLRRKGVRVEVFAAEDSLARSLASEATITNPGGQVGLELQRCRLLAHSHRIRSLAQNDALPRRKSDQEPSRLKGAA